MQPLLTTRLMMPNDSDEIISFDVTEDNGFVHALYVVRTSKNSHRAIIRYSFSKDGGEHWTSPSDVGDEINLISYQGNDVQLAVEGNNLVAIWQIKGELPGMGPMASRYSHDGGKTWFFGENPAGDNNGDQAHIDLIADDKGIFHVVWLADPEENGRQSIRYARSLDGGEHWQASQKLDDSTCSCCWNTLVVSSTGDINVLYRDMQPRDMALMQSTDQGEAWHRISTVGDFKWQFDGCPHIGGGLANAEGVFYSSVWTGLEGKAGLYFLKSGDNGKGWSAPVPLGRMASHSDIAANKNKVVVIWDEIDQEGSSVYSAKSLDGGTTWTTPSRLSSVGKMAVFPRIVSTAQGFLAMWTETRSKQPAQLMIKILD
ncbi:MAG: sialidase family protein [Methylococcales bacterium]|nr:sialidase family protein [Methylococcales bacterium]